MAVLHTNALHGTTMSQHPTSNNGRTFSVGQPMVTNPAQGMSLQQLAAHASQLYNQQYNQHYYQYPVQYGQLSQQVQQQTLPPNDWVFNGEPCSIIEFAERCFGDTPERTAFLLKYTKIGEIE